VRCPGRRPRRCRGGGLSFAGAGLGATDGPTTKCPAAVGERGGLRRERRGRERASARAPADAGVRRRPYYFSAADCLDADGASSAQFTLRPRERESANCFESAVRACGAAVSFGAWCYGRHPQHCTIRGVPMTVVGSSIRAIISSRRRWISASSVKSRASIHAARSSVIADRTQRL